LRKIFCTISCKRRFHCKYSGVHVPASMTYALVKRVNSAGSFLGKKYTKTECLHLQSNITGQSNWRRHFCNWILWAVRDSFLDPKLAFCTDEAWIHLSGYINAQNNQYRSSINPKQNWNVLLPSEYWCVVCHDCYMYSSTHVSFQTLLIQSGISVLFFGPFLRARQSIQGIPSHWAKHSWNT
jgi:hypothetical protein